MPEPMIHFCPHCSERLVKEGEVLEWAGIKMDFPRLCYNGHEVWLTPGQYEIVAALIRKGGQFITSNQLFEYLYLGRPDCDWPELNSLRTMICYIRRKLEKIGINIEGVNRAGYRITAE